MKYYIAVLSSIFFAVPAFSSSWNCDLSIVKDDIATVKNDYLPEQKSVIVSPGQVHDLAGTQFRFSGNEFELSVEVTFPGGLKSTIVARPQKAGAGTIWLANGETYNPLEDEAFEACKKQSKTKDCGADADGEYFQKKLQELTGQTSGLFTNYATFLCQKPANKRL